MAFGIIGGFHPGIPKMSYSTTPWQSSVPVLSEESKGVPKGSRCSTAAHFVKQLELELPGKPAGVKGNTENC